MVFSILIHWFGTEAGYDFGIEHVKDVKGGFVSPSVPGFKYMGDVIGSSITIAVIGFVIHIALAKLVSKKLNYTIDPNQVINYTFHYCRIIYHLSGMVSSWCHEYNSVILWMLCWWIISKPNHDSSQS